MMHRIPVMLPQRCRVDCSARRIIVVALSLLFASCGGGGSASPPPPSGLSYPSPDVFVLGSVIAALAPTVTGSVSGYTVSPALPAGLVLNASTGAISGTPTSVTGASIYTVAATNSGGSSAFAISITVNNLAPAIGYGSATLTLTTGVPLTALTPSNSGGKVVAWSVSPALPAGLTFSATDGTIAGTPVLATPSAAYVVNADNSGGRSSFELTIGVDSSVLLELGHADPIRILRLSVSRALSQESSAGTHWVLWDRSVGSAIAAGDSCSTPCGGPGSRIPDVDLAGPLVVIGTQSGLELRDSTDGHLLAALPIAVSWWHIAPDGSYVCAGNQSGVFAWSSSGQALLSRPGDYSSAVAFAALAEIRVARGPAGLSAIETISVTTAAATVGPLFQGQFNSWFVDGERFLTNVATTVWVYSKSGVQQDITVLPSTANLTGQGNWFWTFDAYAPGTPLNVYAVGASASPTVTYNFYADTVAIPSGLTLAVLPYGSGVASVIDLSGAAPSRVDHAVPIAYLDAYAALSASDWLVGNRDGVVLGGSSQSSAPTYFSLGRAWSIAGSDARIAVATASGSIFYFDAGTKALQGRIDSFSAKAALSSDGTVLAAGGDWNDAQYHSDLPPVIFALPSGVATYAWPSMAPPCANCSTPVSLDITLSASGSVLGQVLTSDDSAGSPYKIRQVSAATGGPLVWSETTAASVDFQPIRLSPDGTLIAVSGGGHDSPTGTNIYRSGTLVAAVPGWAVTWIDNARLLVNVYSGPYAYTGAVIYNPSGLKIGPAALPESWEYQAFGTDSLYSPSLNSVVSLTTGARTWSSANLSTGVGAVAGSRVVFASGHRVLAEPY
jgi:hypothetical protein